MILDYPNKKEESLYLNQQEEKIILNNDFKLFFGDNAKIMRSLLQYHNFGKKIDLVYIDPPFATGQDFKLNVKRTATISHSKGDELAYSDQLTGFRFLEFLRERLILIREMMSNEGSIYLHIDYKIGHYVKIIMDEIFGISQFRNDITRIKCNPKNFSRNGYGNIKDLILFYSKTNNFIWNEPRIEKTEEEIAKQYPKIDQYGRRYTTVPIHAPGETLNGKTSQEWKGMLPPKGRHWRCSPAELDELDRNGDIEWSSTGNPRKKNYAESEKSKTKKLQDIWEFKDKANIEYPTQKNDDLLDIIVKASSNPDSIVMDCFCGSGTTLVSAKRNGRDWLGIDQSEKAIEIATKRLNQI